MTRISNLAANTQLVNQLLRTQARMFDLQEQMSTEKVTQSYKGIATDSRRLINLENTRNNLTKFISNNGEMATQLDITASVIDGIDKTIGYFRGALVNFNIGNKTDQIQIRDIQKKAFDSLKALESFLNISIDGRFIFAGARTTTEPVNLGLKTLADLQSRFDGSTIQYPTTREAQIANFTVGETKAFSTKSFNSGAVSMVFDNATKTITAAAAGTFRYPDGTNLSDGAEIVITGTASNNTTFTIASVSPDGSTVTLTVAPANEPAVMTTATALTPLTFTDNGALADTIAGPAGTFQDAAGNLLGRGTQITISNTTNDGTYTISSVSADGSTATLTSAYTGVVAMTFDDTADTVTAAAGTFRNLDGSPLMPGSSITFSGGTLSALNIGTFTIGSVSADGSTITLSGAPALTDEAATGAAVAGDALTTDTDGSSTAIVSAATNFLTFQRDNAADPPQSIITGQGAAFVNVKAGSFITVTGTANNDGTYEVLSVPNTGQIVVRTQMFTDEVATAAGIAAADGTSVDFSTTGNLTFARDNGASPPLSRVSAAVAGSLSNIKVGQKITISGASAGPPTNNGVYTVAANDGTNLDIVTQMLTDEGTLSTPTLNFTSAGNEVTFTDNTAPAKDTIQANVGRFSGLTKGMSVTITGTTAGANDQVVTVDSVSSDGSTITIKEQVTGGADAATITFLAPFADGVISATSYYKGDQTSLTHRVDSDRDFEFDLNALDPAFEKAIRAMMLIAQGAFQSEGGLDQNTQRAEQSLFLLDSSMKRTVSGTPPFGAELSSNIDQIGIDIAINQILIRDTNDSHRNFIGFLEGSIADVENSDPLETIVRLLDDQRALEASFQALASIRKLTLLNYI